MRLQTIYQKALLSAMFQERSQSELDTIHLLTQKEQKMYSQANHLQQLFNMLKKMHFLAGDRALLRQVANQKKEIYDPDSFYFAKGTNTKDYKSFWHQEGMLGIIRKQIGFYLKVGQSKLQHYEAGQGLFYESDKPSKRGQLLSLFPGQAIRGKMALNQFIKNTSYMLVQDQFAIDVNRLIPYPYNYGDSMQDYQVFKQRYQTKIVRQIQPLEINPYALANYINHAPQNKQPNCIVFLLEVPSDFFFQQLLRFIPVINFHRGQGLGVMIVIALNQIKPGQQLLCDYFKSHLLNVQQVPQWLKQCKIVEDLRMDLIKQAMLLQYFTQMGRTWNIKRKGRVTTQRL